MTAPTDRERAEKIVGGSLAAAVAAEFAAIRREALEEAVKVAEEFTGDQAEQISAAIRNLIDGGE